MLLRVYADWGGERGLDGTESTARLGEGLLQRPNVGGRLVPSGERVALPETQAWCQGTLVSQLHIIQLYFTVAVTWSTFTLHL